MDHLMAVAYYKFFLMYLLTIIELLQDFNDKILDLMRPKTLKVIFADVKTKNDCK